MFVHSHKINYFIRTARYLTPVDKYRIWLVFQSFLYSCCCWYFCLNSSIIQIFSRSTQVHHCFPGSGNQKESSLWITIQSVSQNWQVLHKRYNAAVASFARHTVFSCDPPTPPIGPSMSRLFFGPSNWHLKQMPTWYQNTVKHFTGLQPSFKIYALPSM